LTFLYFFYKKIKKYFKARAQAPRGRAIARAEPLAAREGAFRGRFKTMKKKRLLTFKTFI